MDGSSPLSLGRYRRRMDIVAPVSENIGRVATQIIQSPIVLRRHQGGATTVTAIAFIVGILTGIISGFGIGGGSLLVLYLTAVMGIQQYQAGGINLLYFIGCAPAALVGHVKNKLIDFKAAIWCIVGGVGATIPTALLTKQIDTQLLRRLFGVLVIYVAIREWRYGNKTTH